MTDLLPDETITAAEIAQHLRRMRRLAGMTQGGVAQRLGIEPDSYRMWEFGRGLAGIVKILAAFEAMGCSVKILPPPRKTPSRAWTGAYRAKP